MHFPGVDISVKVEAFLVLGEHIWWQFWDFLQDICGGTDIQEGRT
jgi:hypothetical protein